MGLEMGTMGTIGTMGTMGMGGYGYSSPIFNTSNRHAFRRTQKLLIICLPFLFASSTKHLILL